MADQDTERPKNLREKLCLVMADVGGVGKHGENKAQNYKYQAAADIFDKVQTAFAKHGIAFLSEEVELTWPPTHQTANGGTVFVCIAKMKFVLMDTMDLTPSSKEFSTAAEAIFAIHSGIGFDTSDKALNKAKTAALKYFLKQTLLIGEDEDDGDRDGIEPAATGDSKSNDLDAALPVARPFCPKCKNPDTFYKSRKPEGGWFCWKAKGGCGANYTDAEYEAAKPKPDDQDIDWEPKVDTSTSQEAIEVPPWAPFSPPRGALTDKLAPTPTLPLKPPQKAAKGLSAEQVGQLTRACGSAGVDPYEMLGWFGVKTFEEMTVGQYAQALKELLSRRAKGAEL